jgi:hypothetical protein
MGARSAVERLPDDTQKELNRRLISNAFGDYDGLTAWLAEQGFEISRSAVHRYGQKFEERVRALRIATQQAKAIVEEAPDDQGTMSDALVRLTQEKLFGVLMDLQVDPETIELPKLTRAIADLGRASVQQKRWMTEVREKAEAAASAAEKIASKGGLSADSVAELRRQILGIAG